MRTPDRVKSSSDLIFFGLSFLTRMPAGRTYSSTRDLSSSIPACLSRDRQPAGESRDIRRLADTGRIDPEQQVHHGGVGGDGYLINMVAFYRGLRAGLTDQGVN